MFILILCLFNILKPTLILGDFGLQHGSNIENIQYLICTRKQTNTLSGLFDRGQKSFSKNTVKFMSSVSHRPRLALARSFPQHTRSVCCLSGHPAVSSDW